MFCVQHGLISSVNECVCCIDLNSKLKCASDEISSLNQIIQLLLNDLNSDSGPANSDIGLSTLREIVSMEKDQNVSTCDDWIEVTSKFSSKTNTVRYPDSLLAYQPIPTYNKYAHLINLKDSTENISNTIISNEQGLHCVSQRADHQTEAISKETKLCSLHPYHIKW